MQKLSVSRSDIKYQTTTYKKIGFGFESSIYMLDNETLLKYYCDLKKEILRTRNMCTTLKERSLEFENTIIKLASMQDKIHYSSFPKGIITCDNVTIGAILKYHNNHESFEKIYKLSPEIICKILIDLHKAIKELTDAYIYPTDIHPDNILVGKKNHDVQLIDLDGQYIHVKDNKDEFLANDIYRIYNIITINYITLIFRNTLEYNYSLRISAILSYLGLNDNAIEDVIGNDNTERGSYSLLKVLSKYKRGL